MKRRTIRIIGAIDEDAFGNFSSHLEGLEAESSKTIYIELSSTGGNAYDALAFIGRMRASSCWIVVTGYGLVASAAVLILASAEERRLAKDSWVMVHEDYDKLKGDVVQLEREILHKRRMEDQWVTLLEDYSGTSWKKWEEMQKKTTYLTAAECLKLGLVDKIV